MNFWIFELGFEFQAFVYFYNAIIYIWSIKYIITRDSCLMERVLLNILLGEVFINSILDVI